MTARLARAERLRAPSAASPLATIPWALQAQRAADAGRPAVQAAVLARPAAARAAVGREADAHAPALGPGLSPLPLVAFRVAKTARMDVVARPPVAGEARRTEASSVPCTPATPAGSLGSPVAFADFYLIAHVLDSFQRVRGLSKTRQNPDQIEGVKELTVRALRQVLERCEQ